jgi:hypothetical protein
MPYSEEFGHTSLVRVLFLILMIMLVTLSQSRALYMFVSVLTGATLFIVPILAGYSPSTPMLVFILGSSALWGALYYDTEKYILSLVPARALSRLNEWMGDSNS